MTDTDLEKKYTQLERQFSNFKGSQSQYNDLRKRLEELEDKIIEKLMKKGGWRMNTKKFKGKYSYEQSIVNQLHEEIFKTTSEYKYYELGVATGIYTIHSIILTLIKKGHNEAALNNILDIVGKSSVGNIKHMFDKMVDYDKEIEPSKWGSFFY